MIFSELIGNVVDAVGELFDFGGETQPAPAPAPAPVQSPPQISTGTLLAIGGAVIALIVLLFTFKK